MKKLKILFFGGNFFNLQIAKNCIKLGAQCFLADMSKKCFAAQDKNFINIDFNDRKKIINFIKKKKINFIYISQSDVGIKTLGYINSKLKLPGIDYTVAKILTNKGSIRKILTKNDFFQPKFIISKDPKEIINFIDNKKCIIKPVDSSGSRGVNEIQKISSVKRLIKNALAFSRLKKTIVEEKINGKEFGAQTFSINGKCKYVYLHNDYMSKNNKKIPIGHSMPFNLIKNNRIVLKIKKDIAHAVELMKIKNGPSNVDCIIDKNNRLVILEISPRIGATCLPQILKTYSGVDWDINSIKLANGYKIGKLRERKINVIAKVFESSKCGILDEIRINKNPVNTKTVLILKKNEQISKFTDGSKLFGYTISHGKSYKKVMKHVNLIISSIKIKLKKNVYDY